MNARSREENQYIVFAQGLHLFNIFPHWQIFFFYMDRNIWQEQESLMQPLFWSNIYFAVVGKDSRSWTIVSWLQSQFQNHYSPIWHWFDIHTTQTQQNPLPPTTKKIQGEGNTYLWFISLSCIVFVGFPFLCDLHTAPNSISFSVADGPGPCC